MKTTITLLAFFLCLCHLAEAQQTDSTVLYRHHIGVNTRVVLDRISDAKSRTPLQLIYKYQLSPKSAIRVMGEGYYATSDSTQSLTNRRDEVQHYTIGGSVGLERQYTISRRFMLYYGADVFYQREGRNIEINNNFKEPYPSQDHIEVNVKDILTTTSFGLSPFLGLRYNVGSRFYFSAETALSLRREQSIWDYKFYTKRTTIEGNSSIQPGYTDYDVSRTIISYLPINGLTINYQF